MDKQLEEIRGGIGLKRFHVPGRDYEGESPLIDWPPFLRQLAKHFPTVTTIWGSFQQRDGKWKKIFLSTYRPSWRRGKYPRIFEEIKCPEGRPE